MTAFRGSRFPFAACGRDVTIYEWVRILDPERIRVGDHVIVDDFVFLDGGGGLHLGSYVHIAGFSSIIGGGRATLSDFSGLSAGCRIVTGTEIADGSGLTNPTIPPDLRTVHRGEVVLEEHVLLARTWWFIRTSVSVKVPWWAPAASCWPISSRGRSTSACRRAR